MAHGFVYVLKNPSMPGIYKIGCTNRHPKERMAELSRATACPTEFEMLAFIGCENHQEVEQQIHQALWQFRVNHAREFFAAPPDAIQDLLRQHGDPYFDAFCDSDLYLEIVEVDVKNFRQAKVDHFLSQSADPIDWTPRGLE